VRDGPVVASFHFENITASSLGDLGGEEEHNGGFAGPCEGLIEVFEDAEVAPESLASDESCNVGEDEIGVNPKEVETILLELVFGGEFFLDGCFVGVYAVVNDGDIF